jgi:hypothetical protein
MRVKLHQEAEAKKPGETVDVEEGRGKWLVAEGYASTPADADGVHATSVPEQHDPRLAQNREKPDPTLREQMADGLGMPGSGEPDPNEIEPHPHLDRPDPVERTNGQGDPEKGAKGKEVLERKALATDSSDAVEEDPDVIEEVRKDNDKVEASSQKVEDAKEGTTTTEAAAEAAEKAVKRRRS